MNEFRVETTIQSDGELHLSHLPCRKGDRVEAIVRVVETPDHEKQRREAVERFLALARSSTFRSTAPYPSRDELHERD